MRNSAKTVVIQRGEKRARQQNPHMRRQCRGVTLFELLFGLAIVATLTGFALPSMRTALRAAAVRSAAFELLAGLQQTRASAIATGRAGVLCLTDGNGNCVPEGGTSGAWRAFLVADGNQLPLTTRALPPGVLLRSTRSRVSFWPDSLSASTATLTICDAQGIARPRTVVLSQGGRLRLADATTTACSS
jgi:type IV fimbrial biogenesis protein FimT